MSAMFDLRTIAFRLKSIMNCKLCDAEVLEKVHCCPLGTKILRGTKTIFLLNFER